MIEPLTNFGENPSVIYHQFDDLRPALESVWSHPDEVTILFGMSSPKHLLGYLWVQKRLLCWVHSYPQKSLIPFKKNLVFLRGTTGDHTSWWDSHLPTSINWRLSNGFFDIVWLVVPEITGHATGTNFLEVPTICKVYFLGLCNGI